MYILSAIINIDKIKGNKGESDIDPSRSSPTRRRDKLNQQLWHIEISVIRKVQKEVKFKCRRGKKHVM